MFNPRDVEDLVDQAINMTPKDRTVLLALLPAFLRQFAIECTHIKNRTEALDLAEQIGEAFATLAHNAAVSFIAHESDDALPMVQAVRNTFISSFTFAFLGYLDTGADHMVKIEQVPTPQERPQ